MNPVCNISANAPSKINFLASVRIPVGYQLESIPNYALHLTLDSTNLKTDVIQELVESVIILEKDASGAPTRTINCASAVKRVAVHGTIYYNIVVERFQTAEALQTPPLTAFSSNDVVPVDVTLGFSCAQCDTPIDQLYGFELTITKLDEFVITSNGSQIFYNEADPSDFFDELSDANTTEVIQIPYTITITPTPPVTP